MERVEPRPTERTQSSRKGNHDSHGCYCSDIQVNCTLRPCLLLHGTSMVSISSYSTRQYLHDNTRTATVDILAFILVLQISLAGEFEIAILSRPHCSYIQIVESWVSSTPKQCVAIGPHHHHPSASLDRPTQTPTRHFRALPDSTTTSVLRYFCLYQTLHSRPLSVPFEASRFLLRLLVPPRCLVSNTDDTRDARTWETYFSSAPTSLRDAVDPATHRFCT